MSRYLDPKADEHTKTVAPELLDIPEISQAVCLAEEAAYSQGELNAYETYWDSVRSEKTLSFDNYNQGLAAGLKQVALSMLQNNEPVEKI